MGELKHFDVLIVGAGLSGIDAAVHIGQAFPAKTYALLEQRGELGGTWSLFQYPGIRSDSDMHTLSYAFRPWTGKQAIADGPDILRYLRDTAEAYGVDRHIRYHRKVTRCSWSSVENRWTVTVEIIDNATTSETETLTCDFLVSAAGYFDYEHPFTPDWPSLAEFRGTVVHPQFWPADLDYRGKRVVVIGSGATAITLIPSMAREAGHITMLQRTPTYVISQPRVNPATGRIQRLLGRRRAGNSMRTWYAAGTIGFYEFCTRFPTAARAILKRWASAFLPDDFDYDTHFNPPYDPWDQRVCVVPNGDLFRAIRSHKVDVVTDHIERFTADGIVLASGQTLEADIVVTATGLNVVTMGKAELIVDDEKIELNSAFTYKSLMLSGVPNSAFILGYSNASWTLKADLVCEYVVRLLKHMDRRGYQVAVAPTPTDVNPIPMFDLSSGYVQRALPSMPSAGDRDPWRLKQNWFFDRRLIRKGAIDDGVLEFRH